MDQNLKRFKEQKSAAKQRGIEWRLEYWEWLQIWIDSDHLEERGIRKGQWVMSRPGDVGPYSADNVRIVLRETNTAETRGRPFKRRPKPVYRRLETIDLPSFPWL